MAAFAARGIGGLPGGPLAVALPCAVALVAWGLRHAPRLGAVLAR